MLIMALANTYAKTYNSKTSSPTEIKITCLQYLKNVYIRLLMPNLYFFHKQNYFDVLVYYMYQILDFQMIMPLHS